MELSSAGITEFRVRPKGYDPLPVKASTSAAAKQQVHSDFSAKFEYPLLHRNRRFAGVTWSCRGM